MLTLIAVADQINEMAKQFKPEMVTNQNHLQWDPDNNCIHQAASNMIGKALQDYPVYDLTAQASCPPLVVTTVPPTQQPPLKGGDLTQINQSNQHNNDSLSNSSLFQGMRFMTTTTQLNTLTSRQEKLEKQMQERFKMILSELTKIRKDMQQYNDPNEYEEYGDINQPFSPNHMEDDDSNHYTKSPLYRAANDSHMEDLGSLKWQNPTKVEEGTSGAPLPG